MNREVVVLPGEIMAPYVNVSEDFRLSKDEKQCLDDASQTVDLILSLFIEPFCSCKQCNFLYDDICSVLVV